MNQDIPFFVDKNDVLIRRKEICLIEIVIISYYFYRLFPPQMY